VYIDISPVGSTPLLFPGSMVNITFTTLSGHFYVLQTSSDLINWQRVKFFTATNSQASFIESCGSNSQGVYQLLDDSKL
jgi:hypothetical protein